MTEEIIIDGVEVECCRYYSNQDCLINDDGDLNLCKWHEDCYYKQLKQAENTVNECHKYLAELEDKIESLEQENKELLKYETYYLDKYIELKDSLEEIREIAEKYKDMEGCRIPLGAIKMTVDEVLNE